MDPNKNCYNCAYQGNVPGSAHKSCRFNWGKTELRAPRASESGIQNGWYNFPIDFDPTWQEEMCSAHSDEINPDLACNPIDTFIQYLLKVRGL